MLPVHSEYFCINLIHSAQASLRTSGSRYDRPSIQITRSRITAFAQYSSSSPPLISRPSRRALARSPPGFRRLSEEPAAGRLRKCLPTMWRGATSRVLAEVKEPTERRTVRGRLCRGSLSWVSLWSCERARCIAFQHGHSGSVLTGR